MHVQRTYRYTINIIIINLQLFTLQFLFKIYHVDCASHNLDFFRSLYLYLLLEYTYAFQMVGIIQFGNTQYTFCRFIRFYAFYAGSIKDN